MSIYETSELNKNFRKWFEQDPEGHKEFYKNTLIKYNRKVEHAVNTAIGSKLKKFTGALSSSIKTHAGFGAGNVYVTTYVSNTLQEVRHVRSGSTKHGRYQWYAPGYAGFLHWGTKPHINHKKIRQSKIRKKIEREQAQIAKYQQKLSEHMQKSFLSSKIRLTGADKKAEKYKKIIARYTSQLQKNLAKERENARYKEINGVTARKILAYLAENQDNLANSIYNDIYNRIEQDLSR